MTADQPRVGDTITTADQLDALPLDSIVRGDDGRPWIKRLKDFTLNESAWFTDCSHAAFGADAGGLLPATVLYVPGEQPSPPVEDARADGYCTCNGLDAGGRMGDCGIAAHRAEWAASRAVPSDQGVRHFAPYGSTEASCGVVVPRPVAWDVKVGNYTTDTAFTVLRDETTCEACRSRFVPSDHTATTEDAAAVQHAAEVIYDGLTGGDAENYTLADCIDAAEGLRLAGLLATARPDTSKVASYIAERLMRVWGVTGEDARVIAETALALAEDTPDVPELQAQALEAAAAAREAANRAGEPYARLHDARWLRERAAALRAGGGAS